MDHKYGVKQEYFQSVLCTLKSYHVLVETKNRLEDELSDLKGEVKILGVTYGNTRVQSSGINKSTERNALWNVEDERELLLQILECDNKMKLINDAVDQVDEIYGQVIRLRYIENKNWYEIADALYISERGGRSRIEKGVKDLAYLFYGDRALIKNKIAS